jgi:hypothetical protein
MSAPASFLRLGYGFSGVPQVQNGSKPDEPQVRELTLRSSHIRSLTKTAANRNVAVAIRKWGAS